METAQGLGSQESRHFCVVIVAQRTAQSQHLVYVLERILGGIDQQVQPTTLKPVRRFVGCKLKHMICGQNGRFELASNFKRVRQNSPSFCRRRFLFDSGSSQHNRFIAARAAHAGAADYP